MHDRSDVSHRLTIAAAALLPALLALRLPVSLDGLDSVNFAFGLAEYDPGLDQPHFPGYPVYIVLCRLFALAGFDEAAALALPGIIASPALVLALAVLVRRFELPRMTPIVVLPWLALHPLILAEGSRPTPDLLGTSLVWSALALLALSRARASGIVLGIALGVRLDLAPFAAASLALPAAQRIRFAVGLALGLVTWVPAFVLVTSPEAFALAPEFVRGHFGVWGSLLAGIASPAEVLASVVMLGSGAGGIALACLGAARAPAPLRRFLVCALGPFAAWLLVGQNLANARHFLPLVPACTLLAALGLAALSARTWRPAAAVALVVAALPVYGNALQPPRDGSAFVARVVRACGGCEAVYVGSSKRLFDRYAPSGFPVYRRESLEGIRLDQEAWGPFASILATDEIAGASRFPPAAELGSGHRLYRIDPAALR